MTGQAGFGFPGRPSSCTDPRPSSAGVRLRKSGTTGNPANVSSWHYGSRKLLTIAESEGVVTAVDRLAQAWWRST